MTTTSQITKPTGADSGYAALLTKIVSLIDLRQTWDYLLVTAGMSPYTILAADQEIVIDSPSGDVALVLPAVASSEGRRIRISVHSKAGHTVSTTVADASNINGSATLTHSDYTSKELACLHGKWLAY